MKRESRKGKSQMRGEGIKKEIESNLAMKLCGVQTETRV